MKLRIVLCTLLLCVLAPAYAQTVKIPSGLPLNSAQYKELEKFCGGLSKVERFLLLTVDSLPQSFDDVEPSVEQYLDNFVRYATALKEKKGEVDKANGYIYIARNEGGVELTYWNYGDKKQLIAVRTIIDMCCDTEIYGYLRFYTCQNGEVKRVPTEEVFDEPVRWYEVYSFESYLSMEFSGIYNVYYETTYEFPRSGKDIKVSPIPIGCGPCVQNYEVYYRWNGDGTFTKVSSQLERLWKVVTQ